MSLQKLIERIESDEAKYNDISYADALTLLESSKVMMKALDEIGDFWNVSEPISAGVAKKTKDQVDKICGGSD